MVRRAEQMASTHVALIRGINVGRAKRVAMTDLKKLFEGAGYRDVRTLLNSGNVVFTAPAVKPQVAAARIEGALAAELGIAARVTVLTAAELAVAVSENPLTRIATDPSRLLVSFLASATDRTKLEPLESESWSPDRLAIGKRVAYLWCVDGVLDSPLSQAVGRTLRDGVTTRNWSTVTRLHEMMKGGKP